jgi:hypothetical protein
LRSGVGLASRQSEQQQMGLKDLCHQKREANRMQKITPFLWFDDNAEEAMNFYVSVFKNSKVLASTM